MEGRWKVVVNRKEKAGCVGESDEFLYFDYYYCFFLLFNLIYSREKK